MPVPAKPLPDLDFLNLVLSLDAASGALFWRDRAPEMFQGLQSYLGWHTKFAGKRADRWSANGYRRVGLLINDRQEIYGAHRIIWKMVTGRDPAEEIDHIDRNPANNSISNLREATRSQNSRNRVTPRRGGAFGVYERRGKFIAQISVNGRPQYLGTFVTSDTARLAVEARMSDLDGPLAALHPTQQPPHAGE